MENLNSKVLLFGEYSVLFNSMALVMPCDKFTGQLNFFEEGAETHFAVTSNEYLRKFSAYIADHLDEDFVLEVKKLEAEIERGLFFQSDIPQGYGLGSSGALVVAIFLRYLKKTKEFKDDMKGLTFEKAQKLKDYLSKLESFFHGTSSGLDPLSIILNEPILYKNADDISVAQLPERKENGKNIIFLLNTGITRNTSKLVNRFSEMHKDPVFKDKVSRLLVPYTNDSINSFLHESSEKFYPNLEKLSTFQIEEMAYFIPSIFEDVVKKGLDNGDYFLKLCGAGGGGYMLGFTQDWHAAKTALSDYNLDVIYEY